MKIDALKFKVAAVIKTALFKAKAVTKLPFFKRYAILAVILTVLFTLITFPYEVIVLKQIHKLEGKTVRTIMLTGININLIGESSAENLDLIFKNGESLQIGNIVADLSLNPFSLLKKKFAGDITAARVIYTSDKLRITGNPSCNIDITLDESGSVPSDGQIRAIVDNLRITSDGLELTGGFMMPSSIRATSVNFEADIVNMTLNIKNFVIAGTDLSGRITGSIILMPTAENSKLNLRISIDPESGLLEGFRPLLRQFLDASGKISFPVIGTIARPEAKLGFGGNSEDNNNSRSRNSNSRPSENDPNIPAFDSDPEH